ncbi:MAG TPA: winged helix-turn-helix domain-containing protein [Pyrinomonadaceae bacterium]
MSRKDNELYEFGGFRLDVAEHRLTRIDDVPVPAIPEKAFQTLVHLIRRKGSLVTKKELLETVWPDAIVEENNLDKAIHTLRNTLGENTSEQKYIETVRKHGYRFLVPVRLVSGRSPAPHIEENTSLAPAAVQILSRPQITASGQHVMFDLSLAGLEPDTVPVALAGQSTEEHDDVAADPNADAPPADTAVETVEKNSGHSRKALAAIGVATALVIAGVFGYFEFVRAGLSETKQISIAILPAVAIQTSERDDLYEYGIADALINRLSSARGFVVRPLSATRGYNKPDQDPVAAGREQKTDFVMVVNYQLAGGKVKVTSQLYDVASGKTVDTYRTEDDAGNVFGVQDAIASDLGNRLMAHFGRNLIRQPRERGTADQEAYRNYLQGKYMIAQNRRLEAVDSLKKAVEIDPGYAEAWAALAFTHTGISNGESQDRAQAFKISSEAIDKALAIDPNLSEAYAARCMNKKFYERDFAAAERDCKLTVDLDPNSSMAHSVYASFLATRGQFYEALAEIRTAIDLEPAAYQNRRWHANILYFSRRYDEAIPEIRRLIAMNPRDISRHRWLVWSYEYQGKYAEAFDALLGLLVAYERNEATIQMYKAIYESAGWHGVLIEMERDDGGLRFDNYRRAGMNAQIGNIDRAFELLELAAVERSWTVAFFRVDPAMDPLKDDPRYPDLVRRIESQ